MAAGEKTRVSPSQRPQHSKRLTESLPVPKLKANEQTEDWGQPHHTQSAYPCTTATLARGKANEARQCERYTHAARMYGKNDPPLTKAETPKWYPTMTPNGKRYLPLLWS